jgi:hypothetical protein
MHLLFAAILLIIGGVLIWRGLHAKGKTKIITDTPTSPVSRIVPGVVEVKGKVRAAGPHVLSPMTKAPCVMFHFHVEEWKQHGKSGSWRTVINDIKEAGCILADGTGEVRINLLEAELLLKPDAHAKSGTFNDASAELEATLSAYGRSSQGFIFNKGMKYTETVLHEGDQIYALGTASSHAAGGYQLSKGNNLFIVSDKTEEEVVAHFNRSGLTGFIVGGLLAAAGLGVAALPYVHRLWG